MLKRLKLLIDNLNFSGNIEETVEKFQNSELWGWGYGLKSS